jgi:hypothetical protein
MRASEFIRSARSGPVVAAVALGLIGFTNLSFGAAIVGETRRTEPSPKAAVAIGAMKAEYRRPALIPFPKENPYTPDKASLGKKLYFDTRISVTSAQSCASCHSPGFGWGDGLAVGVGHGMAKLGRHSPTIVNAAWGGIFMWDGRLANLEEQALGPIQSPGEMNMPIEQLMERLATIAEYQPLFAAAFPGAGLSPKSLAAAIATYERTVVSEEEFNLGSQPPGAATDVTFKEPGEALVICAIHPRMKLTVKDYGLTQLSQLRGNAAKYPLQIRGTGQKVFTTRPGLTASRSRRPR